MQANKRQRRLHGILLSVHRDVAVQLENLREATDKLDNIGKPW